MATLRERPYVQFNFLVDLGTGNTNGPQAGFQEVKATSRNIAGDRKFVARRARVCVSA